MYIPAKKIKKISLIIFMTNLLRRITIQMTCMSHDGINLYKWNTPTRFHDFYHDNNSFNKLDRAEYKCIMIFHNCVY